MIELFEQFGFWSLVDVLIIAIVIYNLLILIRGTRAMQMVVGLVITVGFIFVVSQLYPLNTLRWLLNKFYPSLIVILVVLFQDDIRRVLSGMGKKSLVKSNPDQIYSQGILDELTRAASHLASKCTGALMTLERDIILTKYVEIGVSLDAKISAEIIQAIFQTSSPIHDGSIIIQQGRISAAGCFLPLTKDESVNPNYGTRHRASIGITQETDAVVILISEESGVISVVVDGKVSRPVTPKELRKILRNLLSPANNEVIKQQKQRLINLGIMQKKPSKEEETV